MIFKDEVNITVSSGKGGDGAVSFRREKFMPNGGPDGGDGGDGGNVIIRLNPQLLTLANFHTGQKFKAKSGENGMGQQCFGKKGNNIILEMPEGTVISEILEDQTKKIIADLSGNIKEIVIAEGGKGGKGNIHYKSAVKQSPQYAQKGKLGIKKDLCLELKLIAHIGLAGFPNAGKSSLISRLTNARPKVADYPFTTLVPNLGMLIPETYGDGLLIADIPGLIEGASEGRGLGIEFLKHIERTKLLLFVLDISDNPEQKFNILRKELANYSEKLSQQHYVVYFNKTDLMPEISEEILEFSNFLQNKNIPVFFGSAGTGEGLPQLKKDLFTIWKSLPQEVVQNELPKEENDNFDDFTKGLDLLN
ncbi:MAG: GTPase ObgE [Brevinemataceae bacterium]